MTEKQRLVRIQRLVELREQERDTARGKLAEAQRCAAAAERGHVSAEERWASTADEVADGAAVASVHDFADERMHLDGLRREADRARERRRQAELAESREREAATAAQKELRKMEVWSENQTERMRELGNRADQRATDELAARVVRRQKG